jgi:magnesium chelatase subunit D
MNVGALSRSSSAVVVRDADWDDALLAAACIAVDPCGLGGVLVRAGAGPVRDAWLALWRASLPASTPVRNVPLHVDRDRLHGGVDLTASLVAGRPVEQAGLLVQVDGGYAVLSMAERIDVSVAASIAAVLESGDTGRGSRTRFAVIACDEGDADERVPDTLVERLALCVDLRACSIKALVDGPASDIDAARERLQRVTVGDDVIAALCQTAATLGIDSMRMPQFAVRAARAIAALENRDAVDEHDAARAARLVFARRVRRLPSQEAEDESSNGADASADESPETSPETSPDRQEEPASNDDDRERAEAEADADADADAEAEAEAASAPSPEVRESLEDVVLDAAVAAIPAGLLARLAADAAVQRAAPASRSGAGAMARGGRRGSPAGVRRARPRPPERLSLIETLRAAAPWQRIRRAESPERARTTRIQVRAEDLHVVRFKERHPTTTVFVVDASGSSALHRLAEAKGAVELLLADCYVRRDQVAVLAFRGKDTQLLLPPTRSLVRARRSLAGLPGGGGTPLASALDATRTMILSLRRRGDTALAVLLTDGRANVARDGSGGRPQAEADALVSARALRALQADVLLIDTSPQPYPQAARFAEAMGAVYRPLPYAGANEMSALIKRSAGKSA